MQQHSQIIELKDRLVQALDEQLNVKDINEVNRIISILEHTHVTREDLEKTRLGKYINDLRKKTTDKELAKRAKKLIKTWRDLTVGNNSSGSAASNNVSALTSPFNSNSISPHGFAVNQNNGSTKNLNTFYDSKLTPPGSGHHPALLRVKTQHGSLASSNEKPKAYGRSLSPALSPVSHNKLSASFRPQAQPIASPKNTDLTNGYNNKTLSPKNNYQKRNIPNLTPPINHFVASNGLSPGLHNFKNLFAKDGISPNAYRRRTTPPTPNSSTAIYPTSSLIINSDSAASSQRCSPLAFSNDSRDSFSNNKNSYSNQRTSNFDFYDEDSNSSQFSNFSNECSAGGYSTKSEDASKKPGRKRKIDESDTLRENFNYINYGGRRPQSTQELFEKFNMKLDPKIMKKNNDLHSKSFNSLSASSSPCMPLTKESCEISSKRLNNCNGDINFFLNRNGFHSEENSLDGLENTVLHNKFQASLISPEVHKSEVYDNRENSATPDSSKFCDSYAGDEEVGQDDSNDEDEVDYQKVKINSTCDQNLSSLNISKTSESHSNPRVSSNISKIDREIMEIYSRLPKINPEDVTLMQQFQFDNDLDYSQIQNNDINEEIRTGADDQKKYETDDENGDEVKDEVDGIAKHIHHASSNNSNEASFHQNILCDIYNCDTNPNNAIDVCIEQKSSEEDAESLSPTKATQYNYTTSAEISCSLNHHRGISQKISINMNEAKHKNVERENGEVESKLKSLVEPGGSKTTNNLDEDLESKKIAKCFAEKPKMSKVTKALIDRLNNDKWEGFNGNYDKDNVWHDYNEMTSSYVLTGGENANNKSEENVLYILPYVNCTW